MTDHVAPNGSPSGVPILPIGGDAEKEWVRMPTDAFDDFVAKLM